MAEYKKYSLLSPIAPIIYVYRFQTFSCYNNGKFHQNSTENRVRRVVQKWQKARF